MRISYVRILDILRSVPQIRPFGQWWQEASSPKFQNEDSFQWEYHMSAFLIYWEVSPKSDPLASDDKKFLRRSFKMRTASNGKLKARRHKQSPGCCCCFVVLLLAVVAVSEFPSKAGTQPSKGLLTRGSTNLAIRHIGWLVYLTSPPNQLCCWNS
jgi:hypothetical protein